MIVTKVNPKTKTKRKRSTFTVAEVNYVQVPDADERLNRVFKILMSSFENIEENEAIRRWIRARIMVGCLA